MAIHTALRSGTLAAVLLALSAPAIAATQDSHHISVVFDTSGSLDPGRPAVIETVRTLAWSLVLAAQTRALDDVSMSLMAFTDRAVPVAVDGKFRFDVADWPAAAARMGGGNGAVEDGYLGLTNALEAHPPRLGGHLLLVSDEDRDAGSKHTYLDLLSALHQRELALDAFVAVRIKCADGRRALGMTHKGVGYLLSKDGGYGLCTGAGPVAGFGTTVGDYVALALATGGSVWDVTLVSRQGPDARRVQATIEAIAQGYTSVVLNRARWEGQSGQLIAKPVIEPALAVPGELIMLDGMSSRAADGHDAIAQWQWDINGDGAPDLYGPSAAYVFDRPGLYPISLLVSGSGTARDRRTAWIQVRDPAQIPPQR